MSVRKRSGDMANAMGRYVERAALSRPEKRAELQRVPLDAWVPNRKARRTINRSLRRKRVAYQFG